MISKILEIIYPPFNLHIFIKEKYKEFSGNPPGCLAVASHNLLNCLTFLDLLNMFRNLVREVSEKLPGSWLIVVNFFFFRIFRNFKIYVFQFFPGKFGS